jgi:hypothetical protein
MEEFMTFNPRDVYCLGLLSTGPTWVLFFGVRPPESHVVRSRFKIGETIKCARIVLTGSLNTPPVSHVWSTFIPSRTQVSLSGNVSFMSCQDYVCRVGRCRSSSCQQRLLYSLNLSYFTNPGQELRSHSCVLPSISCTRLETVLSPVFCLSVPVRPSISGNPWNISRYSSVFQIPWPILV